MKRWIAGWGLALFALAAACGPDERPAVPPPAPVDDSKPHFGGTLFRRLESDVDTLNPVLFTSREGWLVAMYLFTPVVYLDDHLRPSAGLAQAWDISPDGRRYTLHLNPKATFSDGKPVRAGDVVFTLRKIVDPQTEALQLAAGFEQLDLRQTRAVDDHTVLVVFREPMASQLTHFSTVNVLPEHVYGKGDFAAAFNNTAVGSGPYSLVTFEPGKEIVLDRRLDYWGPKPWIDRVVFRVISSGATAWNAVRRGDVDETNVQSDVWIREQNNPGLKKRLDFRRYYGLSYNYIAWNGRRPLFADKRVRRALTMALDRKTIINNLYEGTARIMDGHFVPDQWAFNPDVAPLPYDPEAAKQIFTSLGWLDTNGDGLLDKGGNPFRFDLMVMSGSASGMAIAQLYQQSLKQLGIDAQIAVMEFAAGIQRVVAGNYDAAYLSWDVDPDPDPFNLFHSSQVPPRGQNFVFYANPEADQLMVQGRRELTVAKRTDVYRRLHEILTEDQPYTWVNQPSVKWVVNRRVNGVKEAKGLGLFLWHPGELDWWLADAAR